MQLEIYAYLYNEIVTMKYRIRNSNRHAPDMLEDLLMNLEEPLIPIMRFIREV